MLLSSWLRQPTADPTELVLVDALPRDSWQALEDGRVASFHQAMPRLAYEVARARRYERPLTIALFAAEIPSPEPASAQRTHPFNADASILVRTWASSAFMTVLLATLLRESLREADIVTYAPRFALCIVGMPETGAEGARHAVRRVQAICVERLLTPVRAGVAEFSKAGWTLEELIRQAETDAGHSISVPQLDSET